MLFTGQLRTEPAKILQGIPHRLRGQIDLLLGLRAAQRPASRDQVPVLLHLETPLVVDSPQLLQELGALANAVSAGSQLTPSMHAREQFTQHQSALNSYAKTLTPAYSNMLKTLWNNWLCVLDRQPETPLPPTFARFWECATGEAFRHQAQLSDEDAIRIASMYRSSIQASGFDGIELHQPDGESVWIAFAPSQVFPLEQNITVTSPLPASDRGLPSSAQCSF